METVYLLIILVAGAIVGDEGRPFRTKAECEAVKIEEGQTRLCAAFKPLPLVWNDASRIQPPLNRRIQVIARVPVVGVRDLVVPWQGLVTFHVEPKEGVAKNARWIDLPDGGLITHWREAPPLP